MIAVIAGALGQMPEPGSTCTAAAPTPPLQVQLVGQDTHAKLTPAVKTLCTSKRNWPGAHDIELAPDAGVAHEYEKGARGDGPPNVRLRMSMYCPAEQTGSDLQGTSVQSDGQARGPDWVNSPAMPLQEAV
jgi:hypothetical protein